MTRHGCHPFLCFSKCNGIVEPNSEIVTCLPCTTSTHPGPLNKHLSLTTLYSISVSLVLSFRIMCWSNWIKSVGFLDVSAFRDMTCDHVMLELLCTRCPSFRRLHIRFINSLVLFSKCTGLKLGILNFGFTYIKKNTVAF